MVSTANLHLYNAEGVRVRVGKWLSELEQTFYGSAVAYDKALQGSSGDLAKVLHRNVFMEGDAGDDKATEGSKLLERYVRRELASLSLTDGAAVLKGHIKFSRGHAADHN